LRTLRLLVAATFLSCLFSACAPAATPVVEPTQVLIPATDTPIPSPVPPPTAETAQPTLLHPDNLLTPTTADTSGETLPEATTDGTGLDDPVADDLVALAQRRVAQELNLPTRRIRLVEVKFYTWADTSLGCPLPGQSYSPATVDGYRIVLATADGKQYIFHTDFDRALPCDAANEQLPTPSGS
jgi:hypothetical protein